MSNGQNLTATHPELLRQFAYKLLENSMLETFEQKITT